MKNSLLNFSKEKNWRIRVDMIGGADIKAQERNVATNAWRSHRARSYSVDMMVFVNQAYLLVSV